MTTSSSPACSPCIYFTRFRPDAAGDGGQRRAAQIMEALAPWAPRVQGLARTEAPWTAWDRALYRVLGGRFDDTWGLLRLHLATSGEYRWWSEQRQRFVWLLRHAARETIRDMDSRDAWPSLALVDDPIFVHPLVHRLRARGIPVIGICHNVETLNRWQVTPAGQRPLFAREIEALAACSLVITISLEETALLNGFGISTAFLPYYPGEPVRTRLAGLRQARERTPPGALLMVGSGGNRVTLQGMGAAIDAWLQQGFGLQGLSLRVGGHGTESLVRALPPGSGITFLGGLDAEALEHEFTTAVASLCHQEEGSGALTRIMDALVAGVPVVASQHAARSHYHVPGVHVYEQLADLPRVIACIQPGNRNTPLPPPPRYLKIQERVERLYGLSGSGNLGPQNPERGSS